MTTPKTYAFLDANDVVINTAIFASDATSDLIQEICVANGGVKYQSFDEFGSCSYGDKWLGYAYQSPKPGDDYEWVKGEFEWYWQKINS